MALKRDRNEFGSRGEGASHSHSTDSGYLSSRRGRKCYMTNCSATRVAAGKKWFSPAACKFLKKDLMTGWKERKEYQGVLKNVFPALYFGVSAEGPPMDLWESPT